MTSRGAVATARALVRASHPEPGLAVTVLAVLLAVAMDAAATTTAVLGLAAASGQLSVGWSNDLLDAERDRVAGRRDKPIADGRLAAVTVRVWCGVAVAVTVGASLALGWRSGLLHLALVALGWSYNVVLKRSAWSWVPYAVCFGLLPVVVSFAASGEAAPGWMAAAGALLGVGAHLVNAVPDLEQDRLTGVRGLPHRLGARRSLDVATVLLLAGSVATVVGPAGRVDAAGLVTLVVVAVLAVAGRVGPGPAAFRSALAIALVDAVAIVARS